MPDTEELNHKLRGDKSRIDLNSSHNLVDDAILTALSSGPKQSGQLKKEVMLSGSVSDSQHYKRLKVLLDSDRIAVQKSGKNVWYALPDMKNQLTRYATRRGKLERHVVENAKSLMDQMLKFRASKVRDDPEEMSLKAKCSMLSEAAAKLRQYHPRLPFWTDAAYDDCRSEYGWSLSCWYRYWLDVLEYFKEY